MNPTQQPLQQQRTLRSRPSLTLLVLSLVSLLSLFSTPTDAALAVRADATTDLHYDTWDPFQGLAPHYSLSGVLVLGVVQKNCTVRVPAAAGPAGQAILGAVDPAHPITATIIAIEYDWLDYCATYDDVSLSSPILSYFTPIYSRLIYYIFSCCTTRRIFVRVCDKHQWGKRVWVPSLHKVVRYREYNIYYWVAQSEGKYM